MAVVDHAVTIAALVQQQLDRVLPPSTRRKTWDKSVDLAAQRPGVFTFIALLTALALPPILLFTTFVLSTLLVALGAAVLFTLFWAGVALLLLVPALFVAVGFAIFFWTWAVGSFIVARWLARRTGFNLGFGSSGSETRGQAATTNGAGRETRKLDIQFDRYRKEKDGERNAVKTEL